MDTLERQVLLAKEDERALEALVTDQKSWILRTASKTARHYVTDSDDEWSVALEAFAEAVRDYAEDKGAFHAFASVVIRRRLLDRLRSEGRHRAEITVMPGAFEDSLDENETGGLELQVRERVAEEAGFARQERAREAREEIEAAQALLKPYGFSFFDLAEASPKAEKTKTSCAKAVRALLEDPALTERLRQSGTLPMKELSLISGVPRKILDRHRRYIIAAAEILGGDFPILAEYMDYIRKG